MRILRFFIFGTLVWMAAGQVYAADQEQPTLKSISDLLMCQCGCNLQLTVCNHVNCPSAIPMRKEITTKLESGISGETIVADFVKVYGVKVLSSPPAQGFNIIAYVFPFVMAFFGLLVIVLILRSWRKSVMSVSPRDPDTKEATAGDRIEKELNEFD